MAKKYWLLLVILFLQCNSILLAQANSVDTAVDYEEYQTDSVAVPVAADEVAPKVEMGEPDSLKFVAHFNDIDTTYNFIIRNGIEDTINKIKLQENYWYVTVGDKPKQKVDDKNNSLGFWAWLARVLSTHLLSVLIWTIIIGIIITLIIFYIKDSKINIFSSSKKKVSIAENTTEEIENIFEINFDNAIAKAIQQQQYKLATRLLFLQQLKTMNDKGVINYAVDKTNFDYLFATNGTKYFANFSACVRNYEYVWYGNFDLNEQQFYQIQQSFTNLKQQL